MCLGHLSIYGNQEREDTGGNFMFWTVKCDTFFLLIPSIFLGLCTLFSHVAIVGSFILFSPSLCRLLLAQRMCTRVQRQLIS